MGIKLLGLISMSFLLVGCNEDVIEYNDRIVDVYDAVSDDYIAYDTYYLETSWGYYDKIADRRLSTIDSIRGRIVELEMIGAFKDNSVLVDAAIEGANGMIGVLETHDKNLLLLWTQYDAEEISEDEYDLQTSETVDAASEELEEISNNFAIVQEAFAKKYGYELYEAE